jgi:hypothetical protein
MFKLASRTAGNSFLIAAAAALKSLLTLAFDCRPFLNHNHLQVLSHGGPPLTLQIFIFAHLEKR